MPRDTECCERVLANHRPLLIAFLKTLSLIPLKIAELLVWRAWCSVPRTHRDEF